MENILGEKKDSNYGWFPPWSAANGISLGQVKVDDKNNEITAIPLLINSLELSGCIVTIDAMGCQKDITQTIIEHDANYIIAIKENKKKIINRLNKSLTIIRIEMK
ncbi:ISAs1 family transposase [Phocaeicola vulgatus]|nr:ISAs1 family transposase [Phocaeicola vulgatus]